jgi:peptidylprolyl isomerase
MKRLFFFVLAACSSNPVTADGGTDGSSGMDSSMDGSTGQDGGCVLGDSGPTSFYCPTGTTFTAYRSAVRTATFPKAGMVLDASADYFAVIETDVGRIVLDLTEALTPITVNSFVFLTLNHFYDGVGFHRVIDGFMAQTGDPNTVDKPSSTWGTGGPGYMYGTEFDPSLKFDSKGVLGMARSTSMTSNGSQFFITFAAQPSLDMMYTVFGKVTEGDAVLDMIKRGNPNANGAVTADPTRMKTVNICQKPR